MCAALPMSRAFTGAAQRAHRLGCPYRATHNSWTGQSRPAPARPLLPVAATTRTTIIRAPSLRTAAEDQLEGSCPADKGIPSLPGYAQLSLSQKIVLACSAAFCLSNMDKTIFTIAVIPMMSSYGWSPTVAGLVQSAFFYGVLLMQLPGGQLSTRLGGGYVLPKGLAVWSGATAAMPLVAGNLPALCLARGVMGAGEALAPSSIIDMIAKTVPNTERASAVSFAFGGLHVGSILGLLISPAIIQAAGFPVLFYTCGMAGMVWLAWFKSIVAEAEHKSPEVAEHLIHHAQLPGLLRTPATASMDQAAAAKQPASSVPYRAFLRNRAVQVLMFTHMCHNWFHYTALSWLPSYLVSTFHVDLMHAAQTALLPPLAGIAASAAAGSLGDGLLARGVPVATTRKLLQSIAFLVPSACLAVMSQLPCDPEHSNLVMACITAALGMSSFSLAGLYCTHGDMSSKYSSALLGLTNVAGSLPGIVGVTFVGSLYDQTHDWNLALFLPSAALMVAGTAAYVAMSKHDAVDFDLEDNSEFPVERAVKGWWAASPLSHAAQQVAEAASAAGQRVQGAVAAVQARTQQQQQQSQGTQAAPARKRGQKQ